MRLLSACTHDEVMGIVEEACDLDFAMGKVWDAPHP